MSEPMSEPMSRSMSKRTHLRNATNETSGTNATGGESSAASRRRATPLRPAAAFVVAFAAGCITVNINFPSAQVEDAAEKIIDEVRPDLANDAAAPVKGRAEGAPPESGFEERASNASTRPSRIVFAGFGIPSSPPRPAGTAKGDDDIEIDIDDPILKRIRESLLERYKSLAPFYEKTAIGETYDGLLEAREEGVVLTLKEKREIERLVKAENRDRKNLYERIVELNDDIDKKDIIKVQRIFGARWQAKCKAGWWVQDKDGKWKRKVAKEGEATFAPGSSARAKLARPKE